MRVALLVLVACGVVDLLACATLLAVVWVEHRRVRREAALAGEVVPSAAGQFGCLAAGGLAGFALLSGAAWLLLTG
ncbi:unnamed protein product [Gemmataceae bacterium]|nr:unnamed protein product [Gemmataceae bacterium]VTT99126.1 unnamed protein product [Gemmataceae bacterium]